MKEDFYPQTQELLGDALNKMTIQVAKRADLETLVEIWFQELAQDGRKFKPEAARLRLQEYRARIGAPDHYFLVAKDSTGEILGFVHYYIEKNSYETKIGEDIIGWIKTIAVRGENKGKGVGRRLLREAAVRLKEEGVRFLYVKTRREAAFYKKDGFEQFAFILRKDLSL
jgi:ribosomal protein S18 acetylase RimI-like enzyme